MVGPELGIDLEDRSPGQSMWKKRKRQFRFVDLEDLVLEEDDDKLSR